MSARRKAVETLPAIAEAAVAPATLDGLEADLVAAQTLPDVRRVLCAAKGLAAALRGLRAAYPLAFRAARVHLEAEARLGEELRTVDRRKAKDGRPKKRPTLDASDPSLKDLGIDSKQEAARWQKVAAVGPRIRERYYAACEAERDYPSRHGLLGFVSDPTILTTDEAEWYTPPEIIESARRVLGEIDLDPASSDAANETVRAVRHYTVLDDGLAQEWAGRVWLNPPYGKAAPAFVARAIETYAGGSGPISAAILLINAHCTDAVWFRSLWDGTLLAFSYGRVDFRAGRGQPAAASTHGSVLILLSADREMRRRFGDEFGAWGAIVERAAP